MQKMPTRKTRECQAPTAQADPRLATHLFFCHRSTED